MFSTLGEWVFWKFHPLVDPHVVLRTPLSIFRAHVTRHAPTPNASYSPILF
jgi:hypothetical protein